MDRIYYRTEEGPIVLIEPSRKEYLERGRFNQPERTDKPAWAHPVIANGKLYIRDQDTLFCYDVIGKVTNPSSWSQSGVNRRGLAMSPRPA
jgi:hypothetical protein